MSNIIYNGKIKVNCPLICDESGYYHLIYCIANKMNGKIYIGKHTTKDPYDKYMGSGKLIIQAIKKYGISLKKYFTALPMKLMLSLKRKN